MSNVPLAITVLGAGGLLVWTGLADPEGGLTGLVGAMLRGEPLPKSPHKPADFSGLTSYAGNLGGGAAGGAGGAVTTGSAAAVIIAEAKKHLGKPYQWGGNGPARFDCSGLTVWAYRAAGIKLPRTADLQMRAGKIVSAPAPGLLVSFGNPASHIGIMVNATQMIHAPRTGDVVKISNINGGAGRPSPMRFIHIKWV